MTMQRATDGLLAERYASVRDELPGHELPWLKALRRDSLVRFAELALPSTRIEEWKYTNLRELAKTRFTPAVLRDGEIDADLSDMGRHLVASPAGHRLVFINGALSDRLSSLGPLPDGVVLKSLREALRTHAAELRPHLVGNGRQIQALEALNTAFMTDGCVLIVPPGVTIAEPIELVFVGAGGAAPLSFNSRNLIIAGASSRARILETYIGRGGQYWSNPVTKIVVGENAELRHYKAQQEDPAAFHLAQTHVVLRNGALYDYFVLTTGGRLARNEVVVTIDGEDARCFLKGVYLAKDKQHSDITTRVEHTKPNGTSRQIFKGVLDGQSRGVFQGKIAVRPGAQKTDSHQLNKTLLLSDQVEMDTKPELEILADDVKCGHGASVGELDDDQLFYLRARGLDLEMSRRMLIRAFLKDVIDEIEYVGAREGFAKIVDDWLISAKS